MSSSEEPRARGLRSIQQVREARSSGKHRWPAPKFWGYAALILAVTAILHWRWSTGKVESERQQLMARQRAVVTELGPRWYPMREKIEGWIQDLARDPGAEVIDHEALKGWDFRERAGIYLRLRVDEATSPEAIRAGAVNSLRDGFTVCLMRVPNANPEAGSACKRSRDCPQGEFCNEIDHCAKPSQPFNMRVAYRTMRVLSDEWVRQVQEADGELSIRVMTGDFEDAVKDDLPLAAQLLQRAQYFLLVLDETPPGQAPAAPDAGPEASEALQAVSHQARVGVWRLSDGKQVLRLRREASGELMGALPAVEEHVLLARQRQANNCALALSVREAMGETGGATGSEKKPEPKPEPTPEN